MEPVDALLEERIPTRHRFVVAPVVGGLEPVRHGCELREHHLADDAVFEQLAQADGEGFVVIVLPHEYRAARRVSGGDHRVVVFHPRERRFLDEDVLAGGERLQCQLEMEARRDGNDHGVHAWVINRRGVVPVAAHAGEAPAELVGFGVLAAGIAAGDDASKGLQGSAMDAGDEATSQKGYAERCWQVSMISDLPASRVRSRFSNPSINHWKIEI